MCRRSRQRIFAVLSLVYRAPAASTLGLLDLRGLMLNLLLIIVSFVAILCVFEVSRQYCINFSCSVRRIRSVLCFLLILSVLAFVNR